MSVGADVDVDDVVCDGDIEVGVDVDVDLF